MNDQVQIHVLALPAITAAFGLCCCLKGVVSCLQNYQFWIPIPLDQTKLLMGKKAEVVPGFEPGLLEGSDFKIQSDNHYTTQPYLVFVPLLNLALMRL